MAELSQSVFAVEVPNNKLAEETSIVKSKHRASTRALVIALLTGLLATTVVSAASDTETAIENAAKILPGVSKDIVEGACKEGSVMLYSLVLKDNSRSVIDGFKKRFPCLDVSVFVGSGGVLMQRFSSEYRGGNNVADVWMNTSPPFAADLIGQKMLLNWRPPNAVPVDEMWKKDGYYYPIGLAYIGIAWNTEAVDAKQRDWLEHVKTWDQLATAPLTGATAMVDIRAGGTTQLTYYFFAKQYSADFWQKLAALKPVIFNGVNPVMDRLTSGDFAVALAVPADVSAGTQFQNGAPLQWTYPEPGLAVAYFVGISAKAPHPNAAKLLMAWSTSSEGQAAWVKSTGLAPASAHIADDRTFAKNAWYMLPKAVYNANWTDISAAFADQTAKFGSIFGNTGK